MIKCLTRGLSASRLAILTATTLSVAAPQQVSAETRINQCSRWNSKPALAWLDSRQGREAARSAAAVMLNAATHGLDPNDYRAESLANEFHILTSDGNKFANKRLRKFNKQFTRSVLCYLQNVSSGRLNPHAVHKGSFLPRQKFNQHKTLGRAFAGGSVASLLTSSAPSSEDYVNLRQSLPHLLELARAEHIPVGLRLAGKVTVHPGDTNPVIETVRQRLAFLGDLTEPAVGGFEGINPDIDPKLADYRLVAALKRFQRRHGLVADGTVNTTVLAAMRVPMTHRIAQTELAMERIRWYPRIETNRVVRVNIPAYTMTATAPDTVGGTDSLSSRVIVGQVGRRSTPLFAGPISRIEFSPTWYVPGSIAKRSILPILRRNPAYMKKRGFFFRLSNGKTSQKVSATNLKRLAKGQIRMFQRPGPSNAMGKVKFLLPNRRAIFLHDTNQRDLFDRNARALSSGCVRIQKPLALAKLLLADNPKWDASRIDRVTSGKSTVVTRTSEDTTVMLQYRTAITGSDGEMQFMPDIYAMDLAAYRAVKRWTKPQIPAAPDTNLLSHLQSNDVAG